MNTTLLDHITVSGCKTEAHAWMDPQKIKKPSTLRNMYLCVNAKGRTAEAADCMACAAPCGYGLRYLDLLGMPHPAQLGSELERIMTTPKVDIYDVLHYFRIHEKNVGLLD